MTFHERTRPIRKWIRREWNVGHGAARVWFYGIMASIAAFVTVSAVAGVAVRRVLGGVALVGPADVPGASTVVLVAGVAGVVRWVRGRV